MEKLSDLARARWYYRNCLVELVDLFHNNKFTAKQQKSILNALLENIDDFIERGHRISLFINKDGAIKVTKSDSLLQAKRNEVISILLDVIRSDEK